MLTADASAADFIKATGQKPLPLEEVVSMIDAYTPEELARLLGEEKTLALANELRNALGLPQR